VDARIRSADQADYALSRGPPDQRGTDKDERAGPPADNRRKKICISAGTKGLRRQVWPTSAKLLSGLQKNVVRGAHGWR